MPNTIKIEYCGGWGYGWIASRVRNLLLQSFPDATMDFKSARGITGKVEVSWIKDGKKEVVWSGGRQETAQN